MVRLLTSRIFQSLGVLFTVYTATFWLLMIIPGDPFVGEKHPPASVIAALHIRYGLTSKPEAYFKYAKRALIHLDLGPTIQYENFSVNDVICAGLPISIALGSLALLIALVLGIATGTFAAIRKGNPLDLLLSSITLLGVSIPTFVVGTLLLVIFGILLPILPVGGWGTFSTLILPATTLAIFYLAYISRLTRVAVLDTLSQDYVRTARAKGLSPRRVITGHVLRNASLPILSYLGPSAAAVLTGSFVVEKIFAIPGLGADFVNACLNRDLPLVLGTVLVYTAIVVLFNLLVDLAYASADPRISLR